jgi:hypothetical protein
VTTSKQYIYCIFFFVYNIFTLKQPIYSATVYGNWNMKCDMRDDIRRPCCCLCRHIAVSIAICMTTSGCTTLTLWRHNFSGWQPLSGEILDVVTSKTSVSAANLAEFSATAFNFQVAFSLKYRKNEGEIFSYVLLNLKLTLRWNHELILIRFHMLCIYRVSREECKKTSVECSLC